MDHHYLLQGIQFQWDMHKATINRQKHHVTFEKACEVFFDPFLYPTTGEIVDEELWEGVIGMTHDWQLFYVAYTLRDDVIRLISARRTTTIQKQQYENQWFEATFGQKSADGHD